MQDYCRIVRDWGILSQDRAGQSGGVHDWTCGVAGCAQQQGNWSWIASPNCGMLIRANKKWNPEQRRTEEQCWEGQQTDAEITIQQQYSAGSPWMARQLVESICCWWRQCTICGTTGLQSTFAYASLGPSDIHW